MLEDLAQQLKPHFKPAVLQRDHTVFEFQFDEGDPFHLTVTGNDFDFSSGKAITPTLTVYVRDHETCFNLLTGRHDGMQAFVDGHYRAGGNIVLSQLLLYLFKSEDPAIAYAVKD